MNPLSRLARVARVASLVTLVLAVPLVAEAAVRKEGTWPADKKVSFDFDGKPSDGLGKLASEAGWSLVVSKAIATDEHDVKIDVADQPADAVLEALFAESNVVARRNGSLITITPDHGAAAQANAGAAEAAPALPTTPAPPAAPTLPVPAAPPAPPAPPAGAAVTTPPVPTVRGEDRSAFGSSLTIGKDEIVHTVTVTGGSATIYGTITGDLVVAGGSARVESGARVVGNATVFGGSLKIERGARVDGDVGIVGGALKREEGAIIGGKVIEGSKGRHHDVDVSSKDGARSAAVRDDDKHGSGRSRLSEAASSVGRSITNMSLLFVFGCVLLALGTRKMEKLRVEAAARPMRSFALGLVGGLCALLALTAMCITLVGIPLALLAGLIGVFSVYAGIAAVLTTFGAAVAGHRSQNPYVHLLVGCVAFFLVGLIPFVGGFVTFVVVMIALGTVVSTRFAGIAQRRPAKSGLV